MKIEPMIQQKEGRKMAETIKVGMVSLGCPKNQCDAELMLAKIAKAGFKIVNEAGLADVVVINTCGFIQSAKEEAIEEIMEAINRKNDGINKKIIVFLMNFFPHIFYLCS